MSKNKKVQSYPHWKQIGFEDCTKDRRELKITEKLLNAEVVSTSVAIGDYLRLNIRGKYKDYA